MEFAQRLKTLRLERDLTQKELSKILGVSTVTIQCWERGEKKPSMDALVSLGKTLKVSVDKLLGLEIETQSYGFILSKDDRDLLRDYQTLDSHGKKVVRTVCVLERERMKELTSTNAPANKIVNIQQPKLRERYIPHYTTPSAAGISAPLDGDDFEMMLVNSSVPEEADFAVNIQGNSMSPYIHDGDMVYVEKDAEICIGDVGIFSVNGAMYCKMYYLDDSGNLVLVSANPDLRDTNVFVTPDSGYDVRCYGRVLLNCNPELPDYIFED